MDSGGRGLAGFKWNQRSRNPGSRSHHGTESIDLRAAMVKAEEGRKICDERCEAEGWVREHGLGRSRAWVDIWCID